MSNITRINKMTHDELIEKYKESLFTNELGEETLTYLEIPKQWYPLVDVLCLQIENHLKQNANACPMYVVQVKEKFEGLRFYVVGGDDYIFGMIAMAEAYSFGL